MRLHFLISKVAPPYISRSMTGERRSQAPERAAGGGLWPWAGHVTELCGQTRVETAGENLQELPVQMP